MHLARRALFHGLLTVATSSLVLAQVEATKVPAKRALPPAAQLKAEARDTVRKGARKTVAEPHKAIEALKNLGSLPINMLETRFAPVQAANDQRTRDLLIKNWTLQFRPILRMEYHFARNVCTMTKEDRFRVARDAERTLSELARLSADSQLGMAERNSGRVRPQEFRQRIQERLAQSLTTHVSTEQANCYRAELERRQASARTAAISNMVAKLDIDLALSEEQRDQIGKALTESWNESWGPSIESALIIDRYFPQVPDLCVVPFLNALQKKYWDASASTRRTLSVSSFSGRAMEDDPLEDDELAEARKAEIEHEPANQRTGPSHQGGRLPEISP